MSTCIHCGKDTGDTNHQLVDIRFTTGLDFIELWEHRVETWICLTTDNTYEGKLSKKASEDARMDYSNRSCICTLDKLISIDPQNARYIKTRGKYLLEMGNYEQAIDDFNDAVGINPDDSEIYFLRGKAHLYLGRTDLAEIDRATAESKRFIPPQ
jgi:tetratricopeptide (TPR) repeat protein